MEKSLSISTFSYRWCSGLRIDGLIVSAIDSGQQAASTANKLDLQPIEHARPYLQAFFLDLTMSERAERFSGLQNGAVGSIAGMQEVVLQQPSVAIKNAVQQSRRIQ